VEEHPTAKQLTAFVEGRLERRETRLIVAHLLRGCPECRGTANQALVPGQSLPDGAYDAAFERTSAAVRKRQRPAAAAPRRKRAPLRLATLAPAG
jgi:anti-sigma factor ChrR (cupin superfamily)